MIRSGKYGLSEVLPFIDKGKSIVLDGETVRVGSIRMRTFKEKGLKCVTCGLEGSFFAMEKDRKSLGYHLNLYAINPVNGTEVLMTHDHIISLAMNGPNTLENSQTMCSPCNCRKGDGRYKPVMKYNEIVNIFRGGSGSIKRNLDRVISLLRDIGGDDEKIRSVFTDFIFSINKMHCMSLKTSALKSVPSDVLLEEYDTHHKEFIPVGKKAIVVPSEGGLYIYHRNSRERLFVHINGNGI